MKSIDGITHKKSMARTLLAIGRSDLKSSRSQGPTLRNHWPVAAAIILVAILINSVTLISAFEAHVINVTATIERRPNQCAALSPGYWRNHEGCRGGAGESIWAAQINTLSSTFSSVFAGYSGAGICAAEWQPNCPSGATREGKLCRAKLHTLADELNLVSGHLDSNALIAGADHGGGAFDRLGLSSASTVAEALTAVERVIADNAIDEAFITDAATVAERLYSFYEDENPIAPQCIFELTDTESQIEVLPVTVIEPVELMATSAATTTTEEATSTPPAIEEAINNPLGGLSGEQSVEQTVLATTTPGVIEAGVEEIEEPELTPAPDEIIDETETVEIDEPVETSSVDEPPATESESAPESEPVSEPVTEAPPTAAPSSE